MSNVQEKIAKRMQEKFGRLHELESDDDEEFIEELIRQTKINKYRLTRSEYDFFFPLWNKKLNSLMT